MKKFISLALVLALVFSVGVASLAAPIVKPAAPVEKTDIDKQIDFIFENLSELSQDSADGLWDYAVTDLDHNGNLELFAAICKAPEYYTYAKIYEVNPERDAFIECDMSVEEGKPFVDILQDSADTYYDKANDIWYYLFSEDFSSSTSEHYAVKCSVSLKDGYVTPKAYATEHIEIINGITAVSFADMNGNLITPDEFNDAGTSAFKDCEKSGTNFSWFTMKDAATASVLTDSYLVFTGEKEATNTLKADQNKITIVDKPSDDPFLMISKNPTSESHKEGETAYFVANANNATSMTWTFVSPSGSTCSAKDFELKFIQCKVSGVNGNTLTIQNVNKSMSGWGAYCTFYGNGQTARSSTAYLTVSSKSAPKPTPTYQPTSSTIGGSVSDYLMSTVTIRLNNGTSVQVPKDICYVYGGHLDYGCSCTCYFSGNKPTSSSIYYVEIKGAQDEPVYNSTSGSYSASGSDNYATAIYVPMVGTTIYVSTSMVSFSGNPYDGCACTVYYTGNTPTGNSGGSVYAVTVFGSSEKPSDPIPAPSGWVCSHCGTWNDEYEVYCAGCGISQSGTSYYEEPYEEPYYEEPYEEPYYEEPYEEPYDNGWTCSGCGAYNEEYDVYCWKCGMSQSGTGYIGDVE